RFAAGSPENGSTASALALCALRAPPVFFDHRFQHLLVQAQIRHQFLQTPVLILQLAQPLRLAHRHPSRTSLSRHKWCASTRPPPALLLPPIAPPPVASALQSSPLRYTSCSPCPYLPPFRLFHIHLCAEGREQVTLSEGWESDASCNVDGFRE